MIHIIVLQSGDECIVDEQDLPKVCNNTWFLSCDGYAVLSGTNKRGITRRMHRIILELTDHRIKVDHIDGNKLNNLRSNLRICSTHQNNLNRRNKLISSSKYKGVYKYGSKWRSQIQFNGKKYQLGIFNDEISAAKAYDIKAKEFFGNFACPNF